MTIAEAAMLARVNHRSLWLHESGYRARRLPEDGESAMRAVEVRSPEGEAYQVALPARVLCLASRISPDACEGSERLDLSGELTAFQEEFNLLGIGSCTCPFWRRHGGRYWCKHYLGAPLLLAHERAARARELADRAARVAEAMRSGAPLRLCSLQERPPGIK